MKEIFHIQEEVARSIVDGLHVKLSKSEEKRVLQRGTDNVEAYEAYLRGAEYYDSHTREGFLKAIDMLTKAIEHDPEFANAYRLKSLAHAEIYRRYERKKSHLTEAERLVKRAIALRPDQWRSYQSLCTVYELEGKLKEAEETAIEYVRKAPRDSHSHNALGYFYMITHQYERAIEPYEKSLHLQPESLQVLWNMVMVCDLAKHKQKAHNWAVKALPYFEKHLQYHPHDQMARVHYPALLHLSGRDEDALQYMRGFGDIHDGTLLYNVAYLQARLNDHVEAVETLKRAIDAGFSHIEVLHRWLAEHPGIPEYEELVKSVEEKNAKHHHH
jgi:Flp pilus assembly protein TadD